jgi:hypothetical protein
VDDVSETVDDARLIEVEPCGLIVSQGIESGSIRKRRASLFQGISPERFKEWMARSDPFEIMLIGRLPISGEESLG